MLIGLGLLLPPGGLRPVADREHRPTPVIALATVTGLDLLKLSGMIGRQLPFFSVIVPIWLIWAETTRLQAPPRSLTPPNRTRSRASACDGIPGPPSYRRS
jgi:hypothetical protein